MSAYHLATQFDRPLPRNGYCWWYIDALSDDSRYGLTLIAFLGSVFSPYYARARAREPTDPLEHCAFNVVLYGGPDHRWSMTERASNALQRSPTTLAIGPSMLAWEGDALMVRIDEIGVPLPRRLRGVIRIHPSTTNATDFALDGGSRHRWRPIAPCARVEVDFERPRITWKGRGYMDSNAGDAPLEGTFRRWHWARAALPGGDTTVLYDLEPCIGTKRSIALRIARDGATEYIEPPPLKRLPRSGWGVERITRCDLGHSATVLQTLEDTPFYARSLVSTSLRQERVHAVHESLSLDRFRAGWVRLLLPARMPRRAAGRRSLRSIRTP